MQTGVISDGLRIVREAWDRSEKVQSKRNDIYQRIWQRYKGFNPNIIDPYRSNMVMPKLYTAIETITPRIAKAMFGKRPYIPIDSEKSPDAAKAIELTLDSYLYKDKFKVKGGQMIKTVGLFGTTFMEPVPVRRMVAEKRQMLSPVYPWQPIEQEVQVPRFYLETRRYMPWQVYVEPHMMSLDDPGYVIICEIVPKSEIIRLINAGRYQNITEDQLSAEGETEDKKVSEKLLKAMNIPRPDDDSGYGVLMRYQSKERYITVWNGILELEDIPNPYKHGKINLVRFAWNQDPMLQNSFWGQPEGKACEGLLDKLDESRNQVSDNNDIINQAVIAYRDQVVQPEQIVFVGGARIPVAHGWSGTIKEAVDILETRGLPADAYQLPMIYDMEIDRAMGSYAPSRGEPERGDKKTATESSLLASAGDLRNEHRAEMLESMGLTDFADRCTSHIDQFATFDDIFNEIGEMAMMTTTMNPHMLPGGFNYQMKGADSVMNDFQRKADFRANVDILSSNPAVWPDGLARKACEMMEWDEREINDVVMTREQFMGAMAQQQQAADDERIKDLVADVIRSQADAKAKGQEQKAKPKGQPDRKKRKASTKPNVSQPTGEAA